MTNKSSCVRMANNASFTRAAALMCALAVGIPPAFGQLRVLHSFSGADGANPYAPLTVWESSLFGSTVHGGMYSQGTLFRIHTDGSGFETLWHHDGYNGAGPYGAVIVTRDLTGNTDLLGMTTYGGSFNRGAIFRYSLEDGECEKQIELGANDAEPRYPYGALLQVGTSFYGLTSEGGTGGSGTLFRYTFPDDVEVLASFDGTQGATLMGSLIHANGFLYGTAGEGGANENGVIFRTDPTGNGEIEVLHSFNYQDGSAPQSTLLQSGSWLFGTTYGGGAHGFGTIFRIREDGSDFQVLHSFDETHGSYPQGHLAMIGSTLYGVAINGGAHGKGTLFQINADGSGFQVLHSFSGADGAYPAGGLVASGDTLFGVTYRGGANDKGTIFAYAIPEPSTAVLLLLAPVVWRLRIHRRRKIGR